MKERKKHLRHHISKRQKRDASSREDLWLDHSCHPLLLLCPPTWAREDELSTLYSRMIRCHQMSSVTQSIGSASRITSPERSCSEPAHTSGGTTLPLLTVEWSQNLAQNGCGQILYTFMLYLNRMADAFLILALNGMRSDKIINWLQQENYAHQEEIYMYTNF